MSGFSDVVIKIGKLLAKTQDSLEQVYYNIQPILAEAQKAFEELGDITEGFKETNRVYIEFTEKSKDLGWSSLMEWPINYNFYVALNTKSKVELNQFYLRYLTKHNCSAVFKLLDDLESNLNNGYKKEIKKIKKILSSDIQNFTIAIPHLYILLDYIFVYQYKGGDLSTDDFMRKKSVQELAIRKKVSEEDYSGFYKIIQYNCLLLLAEHVDFVHFSTPVFNRHHVLHGRYDPSNFKFPDFLRLLVLCSSMSWNIKYEELKDV